MSEQIITIDEALDALRVNAWTQPAPEEKAACGHPGCTDHPGEGRKRIHSVLGGLGADWDLVDAEGLVAGAREVAWIDHPFRHNLRVVTPHGKTYYFEASKPKVGA